MYDTNSSFFLYNPCTDFLQILDRGLPESDKIEDSKVFKRRAHRLLNILADYLKISRLMELSCSAERPVKYGGFADIYHGKYTNPDGEKIEVALKVLKIFQDQSDEGRRMILQKFAKEALVWHYLKHPNIVPFLGVDATTFPSPTMAMVSSWMEQGSVLNYMMENSPASQYEIPLLDDIIQGLIYLHSENIVHGDLCAPNILIHERRALLTDFGLAAFVELETSIKSSTRSGSTRWMAPELLLPYVYQPGLPFRRTPASDVWAFGCVCCEIWTEGQVPFAHLSDGALIMALAYPTSATSSLPYLMKPCDKAGNFMDERLWEIVQLCFKHEATQRPSVQAIAGILFELNHSSTRAADIPEFVVKDFALPTLSALFEDELATVQFGPINLEEYGPSGPEEIFHGIFDGLLKVIRRDVLMGPLRVQKQSSQYLDLRFRTPVEANNFAMTWMVHRFDPYKEVSAVLAQGIDKSSSTSD
ncbi:kinase-like domain-containing protein [Mycena latifolia]|nr:kinase-like domain-containing protein [Mycena latifolia]